MHVIIIILCIVGAIILAMNRSNIVEQRDRAAAEPRTMSSFEYQSIKIKEDVRTINQSIRQMDENRYNQTRLRELDSIIGTCQKRINAGMRCLSIQDSQRIFVPWIDGQSMNINSWMMHAVTKLSSFNY